MGIWEDSQPTYESQIAADEAWWRRFFEDLPLACVLYSGAICAAAMATILVCIAYHLLFG